MIRSLSAELSYIDGGQAADEIQQSIMSARLPGRMQALTNAMAFDANAVTAHSVSCSILDHRYFSSLADSHLFTRSAQDREPTYLLSWSVHAGSWTCYAKRWRVNRLSRERALPRPYLNPRHANLGIRGVFIHQRGRGNLYRSWRAN
jgi:hypothetical protein